MLAKQREVDNQHRHKRSREKSCVNRKKSGERVVAVVGATHNELLDGWAEDGNKACQIGRYTSRPIALLIPRQQVASEGHSQHQHHQH